MNESSFRYVTYIRTTPEALWNALTEPEFVRQYWFGVAVDCDWKVGSPWKLTLPDGRVADTGEIVESVVNNRLAIRWRNEFVPELKAEGWSLCTMDLEPAGDGAVRLTVVHSIDKAGAKLIEAVGGGWPKILSNLKSLLETGRLALVEHKPS